MIFYGLSIEAIVKHDFLFRFIEHEGIRALFKYIYSDITQSCRNIFKKHGLKMFEDEKVKFRDWLDMVEGRICLTSNLYLLLQLIDISHSQLTLLTNNENCTRKF